MTETTNIWQKIQAIMSELTHMQKSGWNDYHNYAYAADEDVLDAVHTQFVKHGLVFLPQMTAVEQADSKTLAQFIFRIVDIDSGEDVELSWFGEANDTQDKGVSKAATSAVKYFLLKFLLIPTGDKSADPDNVGTPTGEGHRATVSQPARNDGKPGDMVIAFSPKDKPELKNKTIAELWKLDPGWVEYLGRSAREAPVKIAAAAYAKMQAEPAEGQHWIEDDKVRRRLWAFANSLKLDDEAVHKALGVEHVSEYQGTMDEAKTLIEAYAERIAG